jgi:uncharacterized protein YegP (UPF0339 family)
MVTGETYQAPSGQWSWRIKDEHGEIAGGAGYPDRESAEQDMLDQIASYQP